MQIDEARRTQSQQASAIWDGVSGVGLDQLVEFQAYSLTILPVDGYVFWTPTVTVKIPGVFHHYQEMVQNEDETVGYATVRFTTLQHITQFSDCPVTTIYIARHGNFRYTFSRQEGFLQDAQLWHYAGECVYPAFASQLLDPGNTIDPTRAIVSNSLPIWLAFNGYSTPYVGGFSNPLTLYPSKVVPANLPPPYGAVHIAPENTRALQNVPQVQQVMVNGVATRVMNQLKADKVKIILYGLQSDEAEEFYGALLEYIGTASTSGMGLMNTPTITDGKRGQAELQALAMQKIIDLEVSYNSLYVKSVALQTIKSATVTFYVNS